MQYNPGTPGKPAVTKVVEVTPAVPATPATITVQLPLSVARTLRLLYGATGYNGANEMHEFCRNLDGFFTDHVGVISYPLSGELVKSRASDERELGNKVFDLAGLIAAQYKDR